MLTIAKLDSKYWLGLLWTPGHALHHCYHCVARTVFKHRSKRTYNHVRNNRLTTLKYREVVKYHHFRLGVLGAML